MKLGTSNSVHALIMANAGQLRIMNIQVKDCNKNYTDFWYNFFAEAKQTHNNTIDHVSSAVEK